MSDISFAPWAHAVALGGRSNISGTLFVQIYRTSWQKITNIQSVFQFRDTLPCFSYSTCIPNNNICYLPISVCAVNAILASWSTRLKSEESVWGIRYQTFWASASIIGSNSPFPREHSPCVLWGSRSWWTSYGTAGTLPWAGWGCVSAYVCWAFSSSWKTGHTPTKHNKCRIFLLP